MSAAIRPAIRASEKPWFRVVEFNVLSNHVHLLCEADDALSLARGVQGLAIRLARRVNKALERDGTLFDQRYHAKALTNPTQVRNALRYVLLNRKHHAAERQFAKGWIDAFSSASWFTGWRTPIRTTSCEPRPTCDPRTWLLSRGWRERAGPIDIDDRPA